jgi:hypothetical protein
MKIFQTIGIALITIGTVSGASLLLSPFKGLLLPLGIEVEGGLFSFWLLYLLCFVGGFLLYSLGAKEPERDEWCDLRQLGDEQQ